MYLYDPRYNLKKETNYQKLEELFDMSYACVENAKAKKEMIKKKWYIIDDTTSKKEIKQMYASYNIKLETWKVIEGSDGEFLVSNHGRFKRIYKSHPEGKFILPYFIYRKVNVNSNKQFVKVKFEGIYKEYNVARLVAYHFVDIYYEGRAIGSTGKALKYKKYTYDDVVVFHKNGLVYDNYHGNLEYLDRQDLAKKTAFKSKGGRVIVAIDADTKEIIDYFKSTRHVAKHLYVSRQAVTDSLNKKWKTNVVGGKYIFKYDD